MKNINTHYLLVCFTLLLLLNLVTSSVSAQNSLQMSPGITKRVSVATSGEQANDYSWYSSISADGRYVAFQSDAANLVVGDTNGETDIFVHDLVTGETTRVSVSSNGIQGNMQSQNPSISADGSYVVFESTADNLVDGDTNATSDVFVHEVSTGVTTRVSVASGGTQGNGWSSFSSISADGRYVAFDSYADNLVSEDTNGDRDIFLRDRIAGETIRVSVASDGTQGDDYSDFTSISADGLYVAFDSFADNLVDGDTNATSDVFVHEVSTGETTRVSVASGGTQGNGRSENPSISADGRYIAFESFAYNLVPKDTNWSWDIFLRDQMAGETTIVSVASNGTQGNQSSDYPSISADGRYVAFQSDADNLVPEDTNGQRDIFLHRGGGIRVHLPLIWR